MFLAEYGVIKLPGAGLELAAFEKRPLYSAADHRLAPQSRRALLVRRAQRTPATSFRARGQGRRAAEGPPVETNRRHGSGAPLQSAASVATCRRSDRWRWLSIQQNRHGELSAGPAGGFHARQHRAAPDRWDTSVVARAFRESSLVALGPLPRRPRRHDRACVAETDTAFHAGLAHSPPGRLSSRCEPELPHHRHRAGRKPGGRLAGGAGCRHGDSGRRHCTALAHPRGRGARRHPPGDSAIEWVSRCNVSDWPHHRVRPCEGGRRRAAAACGSDARGRPFGSERQRRAPVVRIVPPIRM